MTETEREDIAHLLRLLLMLPEPPPAEPGDTQKLEYEWWADVANPKRHEVDGWGPRYVLENVALLIEHLHQAIDEAADEPNLRQVEYALMFFDGQSPALWDALGRVGRNFAAEQDPTAIGRRWAEDVSATAWRLYVRFGDHRARNHGTMTAWTQWYDRYRGRSA